jgi:hypothetical protein
MYPPVDPRVQRAGAFVLFIVGALVAAAGILTHQRTQLPHLIDVPILDFFMLRLTALLLLAIAVAVLAGLVIAGRAPLGIKRFALLVAAALMCPVLIESVLMFAPRSNGNGASFAAVVWYRYYWGAINSLGYRDREIEAPSAVRQRKILAVGDSFTAGAGVRRGDRFTDRIQAALGPAVRVYNAGQAGSGTKDEFERLQAFPMTPDLVILQYFGNDIEDMSPIFNPQDVQPGWAAVDAMFAAASDDGSANPAISAASRLMSGLANSPFVQSCGPVSFACNYVAYSSPPTGAPPYLGQLLRMYATPAVWSAHETDLRRFVSYSKTRGIPLVVIVFPFMQQPVASRYYTEKVSSVFRDSGITVIDLASDVLTLRLRDRVANASDAHASAVVHRIAAERLLQVIH